MGFSYLIVALWTGWPCTAPSMEHCSGNQLLRVTPPQSGRVVLRSALTLQQDRNPKGYVVAAFRRYLLELRRAAGAARRFALNPRIRSENIARMRYGPGLFQAATFTQLDRYPELFRECSNRLQGVPAPRILSLGCSTGEELTTLISYMPDAHIVGVDINPWCLRQCARRGLDQRIRLLHRLSPEFLAMTGFDAIFCMAVFQRTEHRTDNLHPTQSGFTFNHFEREVELLDSKLRPGGLFFLDESDFAFQMTSVAARYRPLEFAGNRIVRERPLFDRENRLIATRSLFTRVFEKIASA